MYGVQALVDQTPQLPMASHLLPQSGHSTVSAGSTVPRNLLLYRNLSVASNTSSAPREEAFALAEAPNHITKRKTRGFASHGEIEMIDSLSNSCSKTLAFLKPYWNLAEMQVPGGLTLRRLFSRSRSGDPRICILTSTQAGTDARVVIIKPLKQPQVLIGHRPKHFTCND